MLVFYFDIGNWARNSRIRTFSKIDKGERRGGAAMDGWTPKALERRQEGVRRQRTRQQVEYQCHKFLERVFFAVFSSLLSAAVCQRKKKAALLINSGLGSI